MNKFAQKRAKEIVGNERIELLAFTTNFYRKNMNPGHRWLVLFMFRLSAKASNKGWKRISDSLQFLSQFFQSMAGFSVVHVSNVPPKIDIYSMGTRFGIANFFIKRRKNWIARLLLLGGNSTDIDIKKQLIASNYR